MSVNVLFDVISDFGLSRITTESGQVLYNTKVPLQAIYSPGTLPVSEKAAKAVQHIHCSVFLAADDVRSILDWKWRCPNPTPEDAEELKVHTLRRDLIQWKRIYSM